MTIVYIINQLRKSGPVEVLYNLVKNLHRFSVTPVIIRMMEDDTDRSITPAFKEYEASKEVYDSLKKDNHLTLSSEIE